MCVASEMDTFQPKYSDESYLEVTVKAKKEKVHGFLTQLTCAIPEQDVCLQVIY
jgi:hypothetical protein